MQEISPVARHFEPLTFLQEIDLVRLHSGDAGCDAKLAATRESIKGVLLDFLARRKLSPERIFLADGFLFLFNEPRYAIWHRLSWWQQRQQVRAVRSHPLYAKRAHALLERSYLAPYIGFSDEMVAKSTAPEVKRAWMRKRLVLQECFWNAIDSISHAAYHQKKYQDQHPALCLLLCHIIDAKGGRSELFFGVDNGIGYRYKKRSRDSAAVRFFYKVYKYFFRTGVFYIGGLELGLLETESSLSCLGSGAVVAQGWGESAG